MARSDEYVLEALLTFDKLGVVVHELLAIEAWKEVGDSKQHWRGVYTLAFSCWFTLRLGWRYEI